MSKIIFLPNQSLGHYNPTFKLAKQLKQHGHIIIYAGEARFKQIVERQSFSFYVLDVKPFRELKLSQEIHKRSRHFLGFLWFNLLSNVTGERRREVEEKIAAFDRFVQAEKPNLFIMDIFLSANFCFMYKYGIKFMIAQIFYPTDQAVNYPPINSVLIPDGTHQTEQLIRREWRKTFRIQNWIRLFKKCLYFGQDYESIQKRIAQKYDAPLAQALDQKRIHHYGLKGIPELVFASKALDFPRPLSPQQYYMGAKVDFSRNEVDCDAHYAKVMATLEQQTHKKRVYCSLGTLSMTHNSKSGLFLKKVIEAFRVTPDYHLILTTGKNLKPDYFKNLPANVHVFYHVPQLEVLKTADIMITHGGTNSVEEAILSGVPLLSYPTNSKWDQKGNTARILYHQLGLNGDLKNATPQSIREKVESLLNNVAYKQNVIKMREQILRSDEGDKALEMILRSLNECRDKAQKAIV